MLEDNDGPSEGGEEEQAKTVKKRKVHPLRPSIFNR